MLKISVGVKIGIEKIECDDTALIGTTLINNDNLFLDIEKPVCIAVADGVGGNKGGKEASIFVMEELSKNNFDEIDKESITSHIHEINTKLIHFARTTDSKINMATTLTAIWLGIEKTYLIHIGNTRAYMKRGNYLKQLTADHTTYQWLLNCGRNEEADMCNKNEIIACMGGNDECLANRLDVSELVLDGNSYTIIITSDGIHDYVDIDDLENIMNEDSKDEEKIKKLMHNAEEKMSMDDKSVMIIRAY